MSQAPTQVAYGCVVGAGESDIWPAAGYALVEELAAVRGRVALIASESGDAARLVERLHSDLGLDLVCLGEALAANQRWPAPADVERACADATIITNIDVLMWPDVHVAPVPFLTGLARRRPTIAVWPGEVVAGRALYGAPGRPDHHDRMLRNVAILRPRPTRFPDEVPFDIERIPA